MREQGHEDPPSDPRPSLAVSGARGETKAVVLVLHGGKAVSREISMSTHLSVLRMIPFAQAVRRRTRKDNVTVIRLRYRYRGWNGAEASPVADARWALGQIRARYGGVPVVLLGHSMGGRTAARVADDPNVCGVVMLAPWLPPGETTDPVRGQDVCVLHGDQDVITSAAESARWVNRAAADGALATFQLIRGGEHFMLRHLREWHRTAAEAVVDDLVRCRALPVLA